jgi:hypothetical protein
VEAATWVVIVTFRPVNALAMEVKFSSKTPVKSNNRDLLECGSLIFCQIYRQEMVSNLHVPLAYFG